MTVHQDIRRALEQKVITVSGFPSAANRAWENFRFEPTTGTTWARMSVQTTEVRPSVRGDAPQRRFDGLFFVDIYSPTNEGPAEGEALADAVMDAFSVGTVLTEGTTVVRFDWAERFPGIEESNWYHIPVSVKWYSYNS